MKETRLGEFEEVILLMVGILGEDAYAFRIAEEFEKQTGRAVSIGATNSTLDRTCIERSKRFQDGVVGTIPCVCRKVELQNIKDNYLTPTVEEAQNDTTRTR